MTVQLRDVQKRLSKGFNYALYLVKNDPQVLTKLRTLALAYMCDPLSTKRIDSIVGTTRLLLEGAQGLPI